MLTATLVDMNDWGTIWVAWLLAALVDAALVLIVVTFVWLVVRRHAAAALGSLLFLLVLLKLVLPLEIPVPDSVASWAPRRLASNWLAEVRVEESQPAQTAPASTEDPAIDPPAEPSEIATSPAIVPEEGIREPFLDVRDFGADAAPSAGVTGGSAYDAESPDSSISSVRPQPAEPVAATPAVEPVAASGVAQPAADPPETSPRLSLPAMLMLAWLTVAAGLFVRSLWKHLRFCRQLRRGRSIDQADLPVDLEQLGRRMGINRRIRVIETEAISSPAVCGIFRPVIVLPRGLLDSMPGAHLEWILLHELAHIRRHDLAVVWFQWLMAIVHFVNPAVWIANRMINRLREYACDDLALAHANASRLDSSEAFMAVVRHAACRPMAMSGVPGVFDESARSSCFRRMTRLLDTQRRLRVRLRVGSLVVLLFATAITLPQLRSVGPVTAQAALESNSDQVESFRRGVADSFERLVPAARAYYASQSIHKSQRRGQAEINRRYSEVDEEFRRQVAEHWPYDAPALVEQQQAYQETLNEVFSLFSRAKGGETPPIDREEAVRQMLHLAEVFPDTPLSDMARFRAAKLFSEVEPHRREDMYKLMREVTLSEAPLNGYRIMAMRELVSEPEENWKRTKNLERFFTSLRELNDSQVLGERLLDPLPVESQTSYLKRITETLAQIEASYAANAAGVTTVAATAASQPEAMQDKPARAEHAAHLTGTVVDREGHPVAGCTVQLFDYFAKRCEWLAPVTTDAEGRFRLPVAEENLLSISRTCAVRAISPDGRQMAVERTGSRFARTLLRDVLDTPLTLSLMPLHETVVEVCDGSGKPVAGATVEGLVDFGQSLPSFVADKTDASGRTRLQIPEGIRIHDVIAFKPGVGFDYLGNRSTSEDALLDFIEEKERIADSLPDSIQLVLDGALTYRAQFKDSTGKPIPGLRVAPWILQKPGKPYDLNTTWSVTPHAVTDAQGIAVFDWIPARLDGDQIELSIYYAQYPHWERPEFEVKAPGVGRSEPDIVVEFAVPAIVSGRITDPEGTPLANVAVENGGSVVLTDAGGNYHIQVVPASGVNGDKRILTLSAPGRAMSAIEATVPGPGETVESVDAVLTQGSVVSIQVLVDEGKMPFPQVRQRIYELGRLPASGPLVTVQSSGENAPPFHDLLALDDEGRCQARLAPGTYTLRAQIPFFKVDRKPMEFVIPEEGDPPALTVQASSVATKEYRVRVVRSDAPNVGLAGATVWFNRDLTAGLDGWRQARTNAEGRVRVLRTQQDPVGYFAVSDDRKWAALGVVDSNQTGEIIITMKPATTLKGRFVDRRGDPISDGYVLLEIDPFVDDRNLANLSPGRPMPGQARKPTGDGTFELTGVATGLPYRVSLTKMVETVLPSGGRSVGPRTVGTERFRVNDAGVIDLGDIRCENESVAPRPAEQRPPAALKALDAGAAERAIAAERSASAPNFHGTVTDPQGQPAAGCEVRLIAITAPSMTAPLYRSEPVKTDQQGHYSISTGPVQDGVAAIALRAWSPDGRQMGHVEPRSVRKLYSAPLTKLTQDPFDIQLAPVEETVVHVQDAGGQPIPGAAVEAYFSGYLPPLTLPVTDANGDTALRYPKGTGIYCILALKSKQGLDWIDNLAPSGGPFQAAGPLPTRVEITLAGAQTRRIQLLDTDGRALQGLTVRPDYFKKASRESTVTFGWSSIASVVTDEQGIAVFDWLPADASTIGGGPTLSFEPASYIYCLGYGFRVPFNPSEADRLYQVVLTPSAVVSGRVTRPDGSPAAGVRIYPETHDNQNPVCFTDADGRYSFRVMPNKFEGPRPNSIGSDPRPLTVVVSNFSRDNPWVAKPLGPMFLTPGQTVDDADFQLARGTQIELRLVIDNGDTTYARLLEIIKQQKPPVRERPRLSLTFLEPQDAPEPAVEIVNPNDHDRLYSKSINFDETGHASFSLPPGSFRLSPSVPCVTYELPEGADPQEELISESPKTEFVLSGTDTERSFEVRVFTEVTKEYRLRAVRADNPDVGVPDVSILIEPDTRAVFQPIRLTTNAEGETTIRRSNRPLTYLAYSADRKLGASEEWLKLDPESDVVTIPMRPTRTATGRFLDNLGQPLKNCRVVCSTTRTMPLYSEHGNSRLMLSHDPTVETTTDDDGRFTVEHLIPGVGYEIRAWKYLDEYERSMPVGDKEIDVPLDGPTDPIDCGDIRGRY